MPTTSSQLQHDDDQRNRPQTYFVSEQTLQKRPNVNVTGLQPKAKSAAFG